MNALDNHNHRLAQITEKLVGVPLDKALAEMGGMDKPGAPVVPATVAAVEAPAAEPAAVAAPEADPPLLDNPPLDPNADLPVAPAAAPAAAPAPERVGSKLQRSLDLARKAEAAQRRAKAETLKVTEQRRQAETLERNAKERDAALADKEVKLRKLEAQYIAKMEKLQTDPLGFAKDHGVTGADIAEYVRNGSDPTARQVELVKRQAAEAIAQVREEAMQQIQGVRDEISADKLNGAKQNFFRFVEHAQTTMPEQFQALDVVYGPEELWSKATELADKSERLALDWDSDRLMEEIERTAKADPRWAKLSSRFTAKKEIATTPQVQPKVSPKVREETPRNEAPARETPPRDDTGKFVQRQTTPMERHAQRVQRLIQTTRFGSF